jgi:hypothetical protein
MSKTKFAFVVDGDFGGALIVSETHPNHELLCAVMRSGPVIIEIPESHPNFDEVTNGWTFDGTNWNPPADPLEV